MVKLRQYPPFCLDGLLRVDRDHQSNNKINTLKPCQSEIRVLKLIQIDMIPKKLITYISVGK